MMEFLHCKLCSVAYDEDGHRPHNPPCSHECCRACLIALVKGGNYKCPKCYLTHKVNVPDDFPVSHGLIEAIRAFKSIKFDNPSPNKIQTKECETTNEERCKVHGKDISNRCLTCQTWMCELCIDAHTALTKCKTIKSSTAVENMKEENNKEINDLLATFDGNLGHVSSDIQTHKDMIKEISDSREKLLKNSEKESKMLLEEMETKRKDILVEAVKRRKELLEEAEKTMQMAERKREELLNEAEKKRKKVLEDADIRRKMLLEESEKYDEEIKKLSNLLIQAKCQKEDLIKSKDNLNATKSPYALMSNIEVLIQRKQSLISWSAKNIAANDFSSLKILKKGKDVHYRHVIRALKEGNNVYIELIINNIKTHAKLSHQKEEIWLHTFWKQSVADDCISIPFDGLQTMIPSEPTLVFLELSVGSTIKGTIKVRLEKKLPNLRENFIQIVTGKTVKSCQGRNLPNYVKSFRGVALPHYGGKQYLYNRYLDYSDSKVTIDSNTTSKAKQGDILGYYDKGYISYLLFYVADPPATNDFGRHWAIIGHIVDNLAIVKGFCDYNTSGVVISDCGLIIEQE